jgi:hypothetical protein
MIPIPSGVRVWIATGHTDMRRGMQVDAIERHTTMKRKPGPDFHRLVTAANPSICAPSVVGVTPKCRAID